MSARERRLTREELLAALDAGWGHFLPTLAKLSEDEQVRYAQAQGYARVQDLLAHVSAWGEETLRVVAGILRGQPVGHYDVDAFNAQAVARCQTWTRASVEAEFESVHSSLRARIAELPAEALTDAQVNRWLDITVVDHYEEHLPPNGQRLQSAAQ